jgi:hypothetical protein
MATPRSFEESGPACSLAFAIPHRPIGDALLLVSGKS